MAKHNNLIEKVIDELIEDQGSRIKDILPITLVDVKQIDKNMISLSQSASIDTIINDIGTGSHTTIKSVLASSLKILLYFIEYPDFDGHFYCLSVIDKLNYLTQLM